MMYKAKVVVCSEIRTNSQRKANTKYNYNKHSNTIIIVNQVVREETERL